MDLKDFLKRGSGSGDAARGARSGGQAGGDGDDLVMGHAVDMIKLIEDALDDEEESVEIPCSAILPVLPEEFRGAQWRAEDVPSAGVKVARNELIKQLKRGRVRLPLMDMAASLPAGWVGDDVPDVAVDLDLSEVVRALPPDMFEVSSRISMTLAAIDHSRIYFRKEDSDVVGGTRAEEIADEPPAAEDVAAVAEPATEEQELDESEAARIEEAERKWREIMDAEREAEKERLRRRAEG